MAADVSPWRGAAQRPGDGGVRRGGKRGRSGDGGAGAAPPAGPEVPHAVRGGGGRECLCEFIWV